jgi:hypothetical protein
VRLRPASIGALSLLGLLGACERAAPPQEPPAAGATPLVTAAVASVPSSATSPKPAPERASAATEEACRVMSIRGSVRRGSGEPVSPREKLSGEGFLELDAGTRLVVKHTTSAREWTLEGPARALICPRGREEINLGLGTLRSEMGPGARPGAEVSVGTPFGTVSYADARVELVISDRELRLSAQAGEAWLAPAGAKAEALVPISGSAKLRRDKPQRLAAERAMTICSDAANRAALLAAALLGPPKGGTVNPGTVNGGAVEGGLGQRAAEHVRARKWARTSCANAAAAVLSELAGREREARLRELAGHEELWQRVPAPR